jgi:hypothetical protein
MTDATLAEYGRKGAMRRWDREVVKLHELDPDTRKAVRLILRLAEKREQRQQAAA